MKVNLIYFKYTGKYYSEGSYESKTDDLAEIWKDVREMMDEHNLPGLIDGHSDFIVSIDVTDHPHNHPHLFIGEK